jgi:inorganic pyrophosphatase
MSVGTYLETLPLNEIARYSGGRPRNALPFAGYLRQHPSEKNKLILIHDPLGMNPSVLEFKIEDVLYVEELHSAVSPNGEGVPLVKIWVRKGAHGVIIEPFEVDEPVQFANKKEDLRERFRKIRSKAPGPEDGAGNGSPKIC